MAVAGVPVTLTPAQFAKTGAAKSGGTYGSYLKYVRTQRAARSSGGGSALDPAPPGQIDALVHSVVSRILASQGLFKPRTDAQLTATATGEVQPQIQSAVDKITGDAQARARAGIASIGGLTKELQAAQTPAIEAANKTALMSAAARAAVGQNLAGEATAQGQQAEQGVAGKLAAAGLTGDSSVFAKNAGELGANAGNTLGTHAATGTADIVNRGAANANAAAALPGIAGLAGIRSGRLLEEQTNKEAGDSERALEAQVPGMISGLFENLKSRDMQTRQARSNLSSQAAQLAATLRSHFGDQEVQKATARAGFGLDQTKLGLQASEFDQANQTKLDLAADKAKEAGTKASAKQEHQAQAALVKANSLGISYLNKHVKPVPIYSTVTDTSTIPPTQKQVVTGYKGYPGYYDMIHGIESQIANVLGPYATQADIVRVSQRLVNNDPHYKPGMNGRPGAGGGHGPGDLSKHPRP